MIITRYAFIPAPAPRVVSSCHLCPDYFFLIRIHTLLVCSIGRRLGSSVVKSLRRCPSKWGFSEKDRISELMNEWGNLLITEGQDLKTPAVEGRPLRREAEIFLPGMGSSAAAAAPSWPACHTEWQLWRLGGRVRRSEQLMLERGTSRRKVVIRGRHSPAVLREPLPPPPRPINTVPHIKPRPGGVVRGGGAYGALARGA